MPTQNQNQNHEHNKKIMAIDGYLFLGLRLLRKHEMDYKQLCNMKKHEA
jgi:hypothetical protein